MSHRLRRAWPILKFVLGLAILVVIGRQFARDLQRSDLWERPIHPGWLALAGGLYVAGQGFSGWFWYRLLWRLGDKPKPATVWRAYTLGHLGKYLPGKAWALLLRAGTARAGGVRLSMAVLTSFYEVLTTMASGALLALLLFGLLAPVSGPALNWTELKRLAQLEAPEGGLGRTILVAFAALLLAVTLVPLWPAVFNRFASSLPSASPGEFPRMRLTWLADGLMLTLLGWSLVGLSLFSVLVGILGTEMPWTLPVLGRVLAGLALAYVAGFVILIAPAGLGVREFLLTLLLTPELEAVAGLQTEGARALTILAVLVLRLTWTMAELAAAAIVLACTRGGSSFPSAGPASPPVAN